MATACAHAVCVPGFGEANCATVCGGIGPTGTYGEGLRPLGTACAACPTTDFSVNFGGLVQTIVSEPTSRIGADTSHDCLSHWVTYGDIWRLPEGAPAAVKSYNDTMTPTLADCLRLCQNSEHCQFVTWAPPPSIECRLRFQRASMYAG